MIEWANAIPLVTLLTVMAAAGGLWVKVGRLVVDVRDAMRRLDRFGDRQAEADQRAAVVETQVGDLISQVKHFQRPRRA